MRKHSNICPDCGAWLDPGEICDCRDELQEAVNIQEMDNDTIDSLFCSLSKEGGSQNG